MSCFFACFRIKGCDRSNAHLVSKSIASKNRDPLVTKNQLASVFLCEEKGSPKEQVGHLSLQENFDRESTSADEELKHEVKFLISCGALLETPPEIRKASETDSGEPPSYHSKLPDDSCKELHWNDHPDSVSPTEVHENSGLQENKSGGNDSEDHQTQRKIVRFEEVEHISENLDASPQIENLIQHLGSDDSPYPTPQSLTEEMQTPGTIYPSKLAGNNTRLRTQYVYPVLTPLENSSQWKALTEGAQLVQSSDQFEQQMGSFVLDGKSSQQISVNFLVKENGSQNQGTNPKEPVDLNQDTPKLAVSSLSDWLKPVNRNAEKLNTKNVTGDRSQLDKSPDADRPIIGSVAAHWSDSEPSRVSAKWFDGNGIPNSTNKYKEDQKVSWHATPFEERLEKALSDEKLFPRRQFGGVPVTLVDEDEESDTAAS